MSKVTQFDGSRRQKHWLVTVVYADGEKFGRLYANLQEAQKFAEDQKESQVVEDTHIQELR